MLELLTASAAALLLAAVLAALGAAGSRDGSLEAPPQKGGFQARAGAASDQLRESIAAAGAGLPPMECLRRGSGPGTDTLTVFSNPGGGRAVLRDPAARGDTVILVAEESYFEAGSWAVLAGDGRLERLAVREISAQGAARALLLAGPLENPFPAGAAAYPARREVFFVDPERGSLIRLVDSRRFVLAPEMREFRAQLRDRFGAVAGDARNAQAVTFSLAGPGRTEAGASARMSLSSMAIARSGR